MYVDLDTIIVGLLGSGALASIITVVVQSLASRGKNKAEAEYTQGKGWESLAKMQDTKINLIDRKYEILKEKYDRIDDKYDRLKADHDKLKLQYETLQEQYIKLEAENAALKTRIFDLETELAAYKQPIHA